jgi:hypothetical protein
MGLFVFGNSKPSHWSMRIHLVILLVQSLVNLLPSPERTATFVLPTLIFDRKTVGCKQFFRHPQTIFVCQILLETHDLMKETRPI